MRHYTVIIERGDHNYGAYAPDVPGCVATGSTVAETLAHFEEALGFHLDGLEADGLPIPEPHTTAHTVVV